MDATTVAYRWHNQTWTLADADQRVEVGWGTGLLEVQVLNGHDRTDYLIDPATATLRPEAKGVWWVGSVAVVMGAFRSVEVLSDGMAVPHALYDIGSGCSNVPDAAEWLRLQLEVDDTPWLRELAGSICRDERTALVVPEARTLLGVAVVDFL